MESQRTVTLCDILESREARSMRQREYIEKWKCPLICFMLNIPGPVKISDAYREVFEKGILNIKDKIFEKGFISVEEKTIDLFTGYEFYMSVKGDIAELKKAMTEIEEENRLGRLFDIDVIGLDGKKISRLEVGMQPRKCLICENPSHVCSRSRAHSVEEMICHIQKLIEESGDEENV